MGKVNEMMRKSSKKKEEKRKVERVSYGVKE
jgi:hypothetical protein